MPCAVVFTASNRNAAPPVLYAAAVTSIIVSVIVIVYSLIQVRAGRWSHVDASVPQERSQLNVFLAILLFGAAALMWWSGLPRPIFAGLAAAGALVVFAQAMWRWLKVSLHASFAVFAASLLWPSVYGTLLILLVAVGVAWSRLELARHTPHEVALGLFAGAVAGMGFNLIAS
ncbi:MAG: phosphatase PAP2 family protein [Burkholderiales bacterium]